MIKMNKVICSLLLLIFTTSVSAQAIYSLDSCRTMALENNKSLKMAEEEIEAAGYNKKSAFANYLPSLKVSGTYLHNTKEIALVSESQLSAIGSSLSNVGNTVGGLVGSISPTLGGALAPALESLNGIPDALREATTLDIHNMFVGMATITQPIYMGGKIVAYNNITKYASEIAIKMKESEVKDILYKVDHTYWQVVALIAKKEMAESYVELLQNLTRDVDDMYEVGVATKSDQLTVAVKLNEAEIALTKVKDGLALSRMLLAQLCGLPIESQFSLEDESKEITLSGRHHNVNMETVFKMRPEICALELATGIYKNKEKVALSEMLPHAAFIANYAVTNPHVFDGFQKKFSGMCSFGVNVSIPIWNWGKDYYKVKAAKAEFRKANYKLEEAKESVELQVNQASFKVNEANKTLMMATANLDKAQENLNNAKEGYKEGVLTTQNVLESQTAWLKAESEKIDAQVNVKLTEVYLKKVTGSKN